MMSPTSPVNRVLVLGGGSAGFLAAITLKTKLPDLDVLVLRSKEIGIIGVGEGTTVLVPNFLHGYVNIDPGEFLRRAQPTYKLGLKFLWGRRDHFNYTFAPQFNMQYVALPKSSGYYCEADEDGRFATVNSALMTLDRAFERRPDGTPGIRNDIAYHVENEHFVAFLESHARSLGVRIEQDTVTHVDHDDDAGVKSLLCESGRRFDADLFIDCSGFASFLLGKTLAEPFVSFGKSLYCDRAVVGGWERGEGEVIKPYTTGETMNCGWCWQIEHEHRINRGYVYSSAFIADEDARREFVEKNPKVNQTRVVKFVSGCYRRAWVKNVVAVGNAGGFVEPLESTSLAIICCECRGLAISLLDCDRRPGPGMALAYNKLHTQQWEDIRGFLALHYRFNDRLDNPFWCECREKTELGEAAEFLEYYQDNGPSTVWRDTLITGHDVFGAEGYLAILVGLKVPYAKRREITPQERNTWRAIQQENRTRAANGLAVKEALQIVRSPNWRYKQGFYKMA
jgi:tryptophan halogenase